LHGELLIIWILRILLASKLGLSFVAMGILVLVGTLIFNLELAIPSILKFSTVFVAYYLIASFRARNTAQLMHCYKTYIHQYQKHTEKPE
jgi:hypothetical protein